jgi:hypothetical protein
MASHLRTRGFEVIEIQDGSKLSARAEVEMISRMDVYITPPGGASFTSIFIRNGGTVIYGTYNSFGLNRGLNSFL